MAARPLVTVQQLEGKEAVEQVKLPAVFRSPIRPDIVHFVHLNMAKNKRQAYAVSEGAGHQHSAESWGTGRAVSRIPRVSGGGTSRAGQAAFGNMCRKGRMFGPTKTWRKWHRKLNLNQKRFATTSALAASALTSLVLGRGHRISHVHEIPLVVPASVESVKTTKEALVILKAIGAYDDVEKCKQSHKIRAGKGKMRNRRYVQRRGPLVVYHKDDGVVRAFRNLGGVELCQVERLSLLNLAPGGHMGRFIIWTRPAFERLDSVWGTTKALSKAKQGYKLPRNIVTNADITAIINSDAVQSVVRPAVTQVVRKRLKKNPLKNLGAMVRLNPHVLSARRKMLREEQVALKRKAEAKAKGVPVPKTAQEKKKKVTRAKYAKQRKACIKRISQ